MRSVVSPLLTISIQRPVWEFWNFCKTAGRSSKGSNPLSSAAKQCFSLGISHFLRVPRGFCSLHAARCVSPAALHFASRCQNRVVFRVALSRHHVLALGSKDLKCFVEDQSQLWENRATTNPATMVMGYLGLRDAHSVHFPIDVVPAERECFRGGANVVSRSNGIGSLAFAC